MSAYLSGQLSLFPKDSGMTLIQWKREKVDFLELFFSLLGAIPLIANPIRMSQTPVQYRHVPPAIGQHTQEVLSQVLGLSADELTALTQQGVFG